MIERSPHDVRLVATGRRRDAGFSLVEILVSVVILGICGVATLNAVAASARGAQIDRVQADSQLAIAAAADAISNSTPLSCTDTAAALTGYRQLARDRVGSLGLARGWSATNVDVVAIKTLPSGGCVASEPQQLTIRVTSPDGKTVKNLDVVLPSYDSAATSTSIAAATSTTVATPVTIGNPLQYATTDFSVVSLGNVALGGTQVYGALGVGGNLTFTGSGPVAANSVGTIGPSLGARTNFGLIVDGQISLTSGVLYVNNGASAAVGSFAGQKYLEPGGTNCLVLTTASACTTPEVAMQGGGNVVLGGHPYDFASAFAAFTSASTAIGQLPGTCVNAATATLRDQNDSAAWSGSGNYTLKLTSGKVNVLNLTVAQATAMASGTAVGSSGSASASTPLVINITDSVVTLGPPTFTQNYPQYVIWNFPNATSVTINGKLWGSLYAPRAVVTVSDDVRGVIVGNTVFANGGVADWSNRPAVTIACTRPG